MDYLTPYKRLRAVCRKCNIYLRPDFALGSFMRYTVNMIISSLIKHSKQITKPVTLMRLRHGTKTLTPLCLIEILQMG